MKTDRGHIPGLDGLRALSIFLVLIGHAYNTVPNHSGISDVAIYFIGNADLGVITFFVISGYLITRLLRRESEDHGGVSLGRFYLRRTLRIFPAFYLYIAVIVLLAAAGVIATSGKNLAAAATFSLNYISFMNPGAQSSPDFRFVGHFWTLALEEQFYLLWPLTLAAFGLLKARRISMGLIFICPLLRVLVYYFWPEGRTQTAGMLPTAADSLMMGGALALCEGQDWFEARLRRISLARVAAGALVIAFLVSPILHHRFMGAYDLPVGRSVNALSMAIIILYVTRSTGSWLAQLLNCRIIVFIGTLSYSLYLWQQPFLTPLNTTWSGRFPLNLIVSLVAALLSHHLVEKPFLSLKRLIPSHVKHDKAAA